jgi:2TM domain
MADDRSYADDEVRAIIERALKKQPEGGVSHADLLAIGAGVGLSPQALESAAEEVREARSNQAAVSAVVSKRRRAVAAHALVFFLVNACLFLINFLTTPGEWWFLFSVFAWGLGLALHAVFGLSTSVSPKRLNRQRRRLEARQLSATSASGGATRERVRVVDAESESESLPESEGAAYETDARNLKRTL